MMNWTAAREQLRTVRGENEQSIVIRRGETPLAAQDMRVEMAGGRASRLQSAAAQEARQAAFVLMEYDADVEKDDRFNWNGLLLRVIFVQPNRLAATIAEAVVVE
jgi:hypothetical protein